MDPEHTVSVDSEVGRLATVMLHRPGNELRRLTPRNNDRLLFDGIPWVSRAQDEHDAFAAALTSRGVEVLYLRELLVEALSGDQVRRDAIHDATTSPRLGDTARGYVRNALADSSPEDLAEVLVAGLRNDELRSPGLVATLLPEDEFLISPLPNLLFTRDSSACIGDRVAVTSLAMPARRRETQLTDLIYRHHPRFGVEPVYTRDLEHVEGGDILLLGPGVIAVGVGERTTPAGVETLARRVFGAGLAHTVLAVPIAQQRATMHLDTICTMVDTDLMLIYPNVVEHLEAYAVTPGEPNESGPSLVVAPPRPFLTTAADALGLDALRHLDTGLDPVTAEREQWDDGNNTLALAPRVCLAYERTEQTNAALSEAGVELIRISGTELGSGRGGPRCMSCPIRRD